MEDRPSGLYERGGRRTLAQIRDDIIARLVMRPSGLNELRNAARVNYRTLRRELARLQVIGVVTSGEIAFLNPETGEIEKEQIWRLVK